MRTKGQIEKIIDDYVQLNEEISNLIYDNSIALFGHEHVRVEYLMTLDAHPARIGVGCILHNTNNPADIVVPIPLDVFTDSQKLSGYIVNMGKHKANDRTRWLREDKDEESASRKEIERLMNKHGIIEYKLPVKTQSSSQNQENHNEH